jgi:hydrogenase nickel incorporation protein HypA/HybF
MHELSIVEALIEQVQREVHRSGQHGRVLGLELSIGRLCGVNCESIRFAFELLSPGTLVEGAKMGIREPKAVCVCSRCRVRSEVDDLVMRCPRCGSDEIVLEGGRDLLLESIEVEDLVDPGKT